MVCEYQDRCQLITLNDSVPYLPRRRVQALTDSYKREVCGKEQAKQVCPHYKALERIAELEERLTRIPTQE